MTDFLPFDEVMKELEAGMPPVPDSGFLGARLDPREAGLVLIPVPWEATTSYGGGTARGPEAMISASHQLDFEDSAFGQPYRAGIAFLPHDHSLLQLNESARPAAMKVIEALERGTVADKELAEVNAASRRVNAKVYDTALEQLHAGKLVGVVGGDHAAPEGLIQALSEFSDEPYGILHFDAHHDLRAAYEGFVHSHASIFYNVMECFPQVERLVQVGIRDYSREEYRYMEGLGERGRCFYGRDLFRMKAEGMTYSEIARTVIDELPARVYISFDIDALDPPYCPNTGTPVPGGLSFDEACYLLESLAESGKQVIGFDLCEVAPGTDGDEWDANVGSRLLYKLCGTMLRSQGLC